MEASHAYLLVPGEVVINSSGMQLPVCGPNVLATCVQTKFDQIRALIGYGSPSKRGVSAAVSVGFDSAFHFVQYSSSQASYNWDCCGVSFEYRRFALGPVRNENQYFFAFTLANIGTFGKFKQQLRLF